MTIKSSVANSFLRKLEKITGEKLTLGRLVWAIRNNDEMSQVAFAKKLAISKQQLCDLEHNRKAVSPKKAVCYAKKLGYPPEQFVRLSLQDMLDRDGLKFYIYITTKNHCTSRQRVPYNRKQKQEKNNA